MLTPGPALMPRRRLSRPGWKGMGQAVTLPSTGIAHASAGAGIPYWAGRPRFGIRGLGQTVPDVSTDASAVTTTDTTGSNLPLGVPYYTGAPISPTPTTPQGGGSLSPFWQSIIGGGVKTAQQIALQQSSYASPLYNLKPGTYFQQTPGGGLVVSTAGVPYGASSLTNTTMGNLLPILLVGGMVVMFMMSRR